MTSEDDVVIWAPLSLAAIQALSGDELDWLFALVYRAGGDG